MDETKNHRLLKKDLRILFASSLLFILVYSKAYTWTWFGSNMFWIIALLFMLYCVFLIGWLLFEIYNWIKGGFQKTQIFRIYLVTIGILIASIYGMR